MGAQDSLINKYRPISFAEVIGNAEVVKALQAAMASGAQHHSYLFSGPPGTGKTSLARIIASFKQAEIREKDIASANGVDDAKALVVEAGFQPLGADTLFFILDECHAYSKQAWSALLKLLEEPPSYAYFALCTTELAKVPDSIKSRCHQVPLKPCSPNEISDYLTVICEIEGWTVENSVFNGIVQAATGQPRKALSILQVGHGVVSLAELAKVVSDVEVADSPINELCRMLIDGGKDWERIKGMLGKIEDAEEAWSIGTRYLMNEMLRSKEDRAKRANALLQALFFPRSGYDRKAQFVAAVTGFLWN